MDKLSFYLGVAADAANLVTVLALVLELLGRWSRDDDQPGR